MIWRPVAAATEAGRSAPVFERLALSRPAGKRKAVVRLSAARRWSLALLGPLLLAAMTATGRAQEAGRGEGSVGIGPQVGFFKSQDADEARAMWGAALRMKLTSGLGVEGSVNYREEEYGDGAVSVKSWPVMVTGLLYPLPVLYGAIGAGWYNSSIDYRYPTGAVLSSETKQEFGWHFGGGLEVPLGASATLVGDVRYVFLDYHFQALPGTGDTKSNFYVIDLGLLFGL